MTKTIVILPKASLDIDEQFAYIARNNFDAAVRFFDGARQTFAQIARTPGMGSRCELKNRRLVGMRKFSVKGFENYLIFYFEREGEIEIVRVLHGSRDIPTILEEEEY